MEKKYKISTRRMIRILQKDKDDVFEAENGLNFIYMNPKSTGGNFLKARRMESLDSILLEKPTSKQVTFENKNPYEYCEVFVLSDNVLKNWKWRKLNKDEYSWIN